MKGVSCLLVVCLVCGLWACGGQTDEERAEALYARADSAFRHRNASLAIALIDSIRQAYPKAFDTRQKGIDLKHQVIIATAQWEIAEADSLRLCLEQRLATQAALPENAPQLMALQDSIQRLHQQSEKAYAKARFYAKHSRK